MLGLSGGIVTADKWYLTEAQAFRSKQGGGLLFNATFRDGASLTDCHVQLELSGRLAELVDELEAEAIRRIYEHLPPLS